MGRGGGAGASTEPVRVITSQAGAKAADENFPVALRLLPGRYRQSLTAVYGFARSADDMGDEAPPAERLALLDELEADLGRLYRPRPGGAGPRLPVVRALAPAVARYAIPAQPFLDLIQANRQDQRVTRYQTFDELLGYCRLSANPVGRIVLHVFGAATPHRERLSDLVSTALQLAEHWQDVAEDLRAGRVPAGPGAARVRGPPGRRPAGRGRAHRRHAARFRQGRGGRVRGGRPGRPRREHRQRLRRARRHPPPAQAPRGGRTPPCLRDGKVT